MKPTDRVQWDYNGETLQGVVLEVIGERLRVTMPDGSIGDVHRDWCKVIGPCLAPINWGPLFLSDVICGNQSEMIDGKDANGNDLRIQSHWSGYGFDGYTIRGYGCLPHNYHAKTIESAKLLASQKLGAAYEAKLEKAQRELSYAMKGLGL